jgi:hypothetical protein
MKKIEFEPAFDFVEHLDIMPPLSSKKFIPEWFKKLNPFIQKHHKNFCNPDGYNLTSKNCIPMIDSMSIGYILTLPCDITFVDPDLYGSRVIWDQVGWQVIEGHSYEQIDGIQVPEEFEKNPLKFMGLWKIKPENGYSLLYTHPFWHLDLPFLTTTGIVDSDIYNHQVNLPFFIKKNFFGTIKKDTPIAQIIPIKRENWQGKVTKYKESSKFSYANIRLKSHRSYKLRFWQKKEYL